MTTLVGDAAILQSALERSAEAWTALLARYAPAARAVSRLVFERYREPVTAADLDEVTTEVFERVARDDFQWLRSLRGPEILGPSIRILAAWRALGQLRVRREAFTCALEVEVRFGNHHVATAVLARPPAKERAPLIGREEADRLVADLTAKMGQRPTRILEAVYCDNRPYQAIAAKEGAPVVTVAQTLCEARRRLADALAQVAPEAEL